LAPLAVPLNGIHWNGIRNYFNFKTVQRATLDLDASNQESRAKRALFPWLLYLTASRSAAKIVGGREESDREYYAAR
jgi:hypothetical protein